MITEEAGMLSGWVYVDTSDADIGGYVARAKAAVARELELKPGYFLKWTGQYEFLERIRARMQFVVPITIALILVVLYFNFGGFVQALLVMISLPSAAIGSVWLMYALGYNTSIAVWVGFIALLGVAAETASVMVIYLEQGMRQWKAEGRLNGRRDLVDMVLETAVHRARPLLMAVGMNIFGLIPVMFAVGIGSDVAKRLAAPLWGGLISLTVLTLLVIPAIYVIWRERSLPKSAG